MWVQTFLQARNNCKPFCERAKDVPPLLSKRRHRAGRGEDSDPSAAEGLTRKEFHCSQINHRGDNDDDDDKNFHNNDNTSYINDG